MKTILLQGAMDIEIDVFLSVLDNPEKEIHDGYTFYVGTIGNLKVVLSKTKIGIMNGALATMAGVHEYHPDFVLNQGTAGAHLESIHTGDIVLCHQAEYLNSLVMPVRKEGEGSNSLEWTFHKDTKTRFGDQDLMNRFYGHDYSKGEIYTGIIGSGDIYSREVDRIHWIHKLKGNLCEDMETVAVFAACEKMQIPCLGVRVISNNELLREPFNKETARWLQEFIVEVLYTF